MVGAAKWLIKDQDKELLDETLEVRKTTSKKAPELRRKGLLDYLANPLLELVKERSASLLQSTVGCQFISETLLSVDGSGKDDAKAAVAELASGDPSADDHIAHSAAAGRMLKTLALGGNFDLKTKSVQLSEPRLGFSTTLWPVIKDHVLAWACSASSFVVVALTESEDVSANVRQEVLASLKKGRKQIQAAAGAKGDGKGKKKDKSDVGSKGNAGARMLLEKIA